MSSSLVDRYADRIVGVISSFDRLLITGTLPGICHAEGMSSYLWAQGIRIFDFTRFAEPLRDALVAHVERLVPAAGLQVEYVRSVQTFRKEERVQEILAARGTQPGLVHVFSAVERCSTYEPWHNKATGKTYLRPREGKCLHYYFYFLDAEFGLCFLRVPTYAPFRLQFYCNGHQWLASRLRQAGIAYLPLDNTFREIGDFPQAQALADDCPAERLHRLLDRVVAEFCPALMAFETGYHWSLQQVEYATDLIFRSAKDLQPLYETLVRTAVHAVKPHHIATFLGRKLHPAYEGELGNHFETRIQGTRIKHLMGPVSLKMYDKQGLVLRVETTVNDVSFFKHYREVEHRDGTKTVKLAGMRKTIYSLGLLREILLAVNQRYLEFLAQLADPSAGLPKATQLSAPRKEGDRSYRGFNLFQQADLDLLVALAQGQHCVQGVQNRTLRHLLPGMTGPQLSRQLKRLYVHGLIRKVGHRYRYYLSQWGQEVILTALKLRELVVIPSLAGLHPA